MISSDRMAAVDQNAEALGVPRRQLMESSGNAIAREVREMCEPGDRVCIVCGRGNNGGDGFVAARFLDAFEVSVQLLGRPTAITTEIARANWEALVAAEIDCTVITDSRDLDLPEADLLVDALVGTGITGALREPVNTAAGQLNDHPADILAVDVPSGVDADTGEQGASAVEADRIVTFHDTKPGLASLDIPVTVADIGIPAAAELFVERGDLQSVSRDPESHKGDAGRVLVIGGGPYAGAPALSAQAALRVGADLGMVAAPQRVAQSIQSFAADLIVHDLSGDHFAPGDVERAVRLANGADSVILGPGLGEDDATLQAVGEWLTTFEGRVVVDAEALRVVPAVDAAGSLVCTPHQGELAEMGGPTAEDWRERMAAVEAFAEELGHTLVVKGRYDVISDGERTRVNRTGNPGMTVGGTGDVLAGVIGALLADDRRDPVDAGALGAYVSGAAGDMAERERGYGLLASDVIDHLPTVLWGDQA